MFCENVERLAKLGMLIFAGAIHGALLSFTNPLPPSHDERERRAREPPVLVDGDRRFWRLLRGSSYSSTSPTAESAIRISPAFFSKITNILS